MLVVNNLTCSFGNQAIAPDTAITGYSRSSVEYDQSCEDYRMTTVCDGSSGLPVEEIYAPCSANNHEFKTVWDLTKPASVGSGTAGNQLRLPLASDGDYYFEVDWGDGSPKEKVTSATVPVLHTYDPAVTSATVTLKGRYSRLAMLESGAYIADAAKLVDVAQWGTNPWKSMTSMFHGASNLVEFSASDPPDTKAVTSMANMFNRATLFDGSLDGFDTSNVTSMANMFQNASSFDQPLNNFVTDKVTNMSFMFNGAVSFNKPINHFNTASVTSMSNLFYGATSFNQTLSNWNTSKVTTMLTMFSGASSFVRDLRSQVGEGSWNVCSVTTSTSFSASTSASWTSGMKPSFGDPTKCGAL